MNTNAFITGRLFLTPAATVSNRMAGWMQASVRRPSNLSDPALIGCILFKGVGRPTVSPKGLLPRAHKTCTM